MVLSATLGFPRMGEHRELKKAMESFWAGKSTEQQLLDTAKRLRLTHWKLQKGQGVDIIPSGDFSLYDHMLDHSIMFNVIPKRYIDLGLSDGEQLFAMGRGLQRPAQGEKGAVDVTSLEMVKWFDSNYHYMRPEVSSSTQFKLSSSKAVDEFIETKNAGINTRPVLIGPVTYLALAKVEAGTDTSVRPISLIKQLVVAYDELLSNLKQAGADWVQIDEPISCTRCER